MQTLIALGLLKMGLDGLFQIVLPCLAVLLMVIYSLINSACKLIGRK